ncbi:MAG: carboxymuconolactone decarboxylase family protein [Chloroflexi bacterium]|nr:carboxymuconolactone decarboxylase family protein [Chloroflexota bacterium]
MPWIREEINEQTARLSNVIRVMSINPRAMKAVIELGNSVTFGSSALTRTQEEAIATVVSVANKCRY